MICPQEAALALHSERNVVILDLASVLQVLIRSFGFLVIHIDCSNLYAVLLCELLICFVSLLFFNGHRFLIFCFLLRLSGFNSMWVFQDISHSLWHHCCMIVLLASSFLEKRLQDILGGISPSPQSHIESYIYSFIQLLNSQKVVLITCGFSFAGKAKS